MAGVGGISVLRAVYRALRMVYSGAGLLRFAAFGPVAQWLEPTAHNGLVGGSSPPGPTNEFNRLRWGRGRLFRYRQ